MMIENGKFTLERVRISGRDLSLWTEEAAKSLDSKERNSMLEISFFADSYDTDEIALSDVTVVVSRGLVSFDIEIPALLDALTNAYLPQECAKFSRCLVKKQGDKLISYDMRLQGHPKQIISEDAGTAALFEAIQTLKGLPREVFIEGENDE